jgi:predicted DCC family thiol-disulfide oxidoreductase YuxK
MGVTADGSVAGTVSEVTMGDARETLVTPRYVLCFDGECGLCSWAVAWFHAHDRHQRIWYAPLQGEFAEPFRGAARGDPSANRGFETVLFLETTPAGTAVHARSRAVARALRAVGGAWGFLGALLERVPRFIADAAYDAVSRRRATLGAAPCSLAGRPSRLLP